MFLIYSQKLATARLK